MPDVLIDSSIVIDALRGNPRAVRFLEKAVAAKEAVAHGQVIAEIVTGSHSSGEQAKLIRFLRTMRWVHPSEADFAEGIRFLMRFHLSHDLGFGDCIIGATALRLNLPVATLNVRDFRLFPGLKVMRPF